MYLTEFHIWQNMLRNRDDPIDLTTEESKIEPNFPKDKRKEEQITTEATVTQLGNTEQLEKLIETIVVKVLRKNL